VSCCHVYVEALRRADPPSRESYQISNVINNFRFGTDHKASFQLLLLIMMIMMLKEHRLMAYV